MKRDHLVPCKRLIRSVDRGVLLEQRSLQSYAPLGRRLLVGLAVTAVGMGRSCVAGRHRVGLPVCCAWWPGRRWVVAGLRLGHAHPASLHPPNNISSVRKHCTHTLSFPEHPFQSTT